MNSAGEVGVKANGEPFGALDCEFACFASSCIDLKVMFKLTKLSVGESGNDVTVCTFLSNWIRLCSSMFR